MEAVGTPPADRLKAMLPLFYYGLKTPDSRVPTPIMAPCACSRPISIQGRTCAAYRNWTTAGLSCKTASGLFCCFRYRYLLGRDPPPGPEGPGGVQSIGIARHDVGRHGDLLKVRNLVLPKVVHERVAPCLGQDASFRFLPKKLPS